MNQPSEDFEALRKLLKLKRYEQPPPGYFNNFSLKVLARLEADNGSRKADLLSGDAPWARKLVRMLETNPFFAGAFGVAVCGVLIFGVTSFQNVDRMAPVAIVTDGGDANVSAPAFLAKSASETLSSINPRFSTNVSGGSPFGVATVEPVVFSPDH